MRRDAAVEFADRSMEAVCYYAYWASTELAEERGRYASLPRLAVGPRHPAAGLAQAAGRGARRLRRGRRSATHGLGRAARAHRGARHAQLELRRDRADRDDLQHHRRVGLDRADVPEPVREVEPVGRVHGGQRVPGARPEDARPVGRGDGRRPQVLRRLAARRSTACPQDLRELYATAFEVEPKWLVEAGARRQKWIDQAQSLNIYMAGASGKKLDETYKLAWLRGLKTTYYLRTHRRDARREVDRQGRRAERGVGRRRACRGSAAAGTPAQAIGRSRSLRACSCCSRSTTRDCEVAASDAGCDACVTAGAARRCARAHRTRASMRAATGMRCMSISAWILSATLT